MTPERQSLSFMYIESDIPAGMTIREWRVHRGTRRPGRRRLAIAARVIHIAIQSSIFHG